MGFEFEFDSLEDFLKELQDKLNSIGGDIALNDFFNDEFMKEYTSFQNIEDFFLQGKFTVDSHEDFEKLDETLLDKYVEEKTKFSSWEEMKQEAAEIYISKELNRIGFN